MPILIHVVYLVDDRLRHVARVYGGRFVSQRANAAAYATGLSCRGSEAN